ncbi:hypothetical protein BDB01DRAFT_729194 [Pilobolus umbonatus]|nr:hypothetical protein BDB01DRAFT_729194 [Pilobolus umbonatus]
MSSVSWMAEKTSNDLIPMLKNAYHALKDKERDLVLAAELGKSLLEHNLKLKANYDNLLKTSTPPITPSSSTETVVIQDEDSGIDSCDEDHTMRFIPSRGTRNAMIEVLERNNHEMSRKLEQAMQEQDALTKMNTKNTRKLENEIALLQSNLEIASNKIQELHSMNEKKKTSVEVKVVDEDQEVLVDELYNEIDKAEKEKYEMEQSKLEIELKLATTLKDLRELRDQFEKFEFTQQDYEKLQEAYERQFDHINELNSSLEEHRGVLQKLKEKGVTVYSPHSSAAPSEAGDEPQSTLLGELESAWIKKNSTSLPNSLSGPFLRDLTDFTERSLVAFYQAPSVGLESILSKATGLDQQVLDDTLSLIHQIEQEHYEEKRLALYNPEDISPYDLVAQDHLPEDHLYPEPPVFMPLTQFVDQTATTFIEKLKEYVRKLFRVVWRWCRFTMILTTALLISAWQGPDSLLIAYQH